MKIIKNSILLTIIFFCLSSNYTAKAQDTIVIDKILAVVGNSIVKLSDIENQYIQYVAQGYSPTGDMKCQIFEEMLFQGLLLTQAALDSIEVTEKDVESELDRRLTMFIQRAGSEAALEEYFNKSIVEIKEEFRSVVKDQLITQRMQETITAEVAVSPSEVRKFYNSIPADSLPLIGAEVEVLQISKYPKITDEDIALVKDKLNQMRERIVKGENFSALATLYSEDEGTATEGGELGFIGRGMLDPDFAAAAFRLEKNEVSEVVESAFGYHIIQMIERRGEQINVRHILMRPKVRPNQKNEAKTILDSLRNALNTDTLTFSEMAMLHSDDDETKRNGGIMINPYTNTSKFEIEQLDPATNFEINKLMVGEISKPFEAVDNKGTTVYRIILLKSRSRAHVANLEMDYNFIKDLALEDKKQKMLEEWILEKQKTTYVRIEDAYLNCNFSYKGWIK